MIATESEGGGRRRKKGKVQSPRTLSHLSAPISRRASVCITAATCPPTLCHRLNISVPSDGRRSKAAAAAADQSIGCCESETKVAEAKEEEAGEKVEGSGSWVARNRCSRSAHAVYSWAGPTLAAAAAGYATGAAVAPSWSRVWLELHACKSSCPVRCCLLCWNTLSRKSSASAFGYGAMAAAPSLATLQAADADFGEALNIIQSRQRQKRAYTDKFN